MSEANEVAEPQSEPSVTMWAYCGITDMGAPFVRLVRNEQPLIQVHPDAARSLGLALMESADAADQDAFMYAFWRNTFGKSHEDAMMMIGALRRFRQAKRDEAKAAMESSRLVTPAGVNRTRG